MKQSTNFAIHAVAMLVTGNAVAAPFEEAAAGGAPESVAAPADETALEEIVVSATKRETDVQKTPISITVLGGDTLKQRRVVGLSDLFDGSVPSLRVAPFEARQNALTIGIRGIVPGDANQPAREQGVGVYIDGVYLGRQHGLNTALFDIERVEVLKGPQGTLFGRNTEGGALSIINRAPTGEFGGRVTGGVGNYGSYNAEAHFDLPEFHTFSVKLDGVIQHQDATTKNPLAGQEGWNMADRRGFRAAVRWQPIDGLTDDLSYDLGHAETTPLYSQLLNYNPNGCISGGTATAPIAQSRAPACYLPGTAYTGLTGTIRPPLPGVVINGDSIMPVADIGVPQQPSVDDTHGLTNILKYKLMPEVELRSITAWRGVTSTQWDNSGGAHRPPVVAPNCTGTGCNFSRYSLANLRQDQFSQEFEAVGTVGTVDYVGGLYYFVENVDDDAATPNSLAISGYTAAGQTSGYSYVVLDPCTGSGGFGSQLGCRSIDRASTVRSRSQAIFGQATWHATDKLSLIVGGRYTDDNKKGELLFSRNINYRTNPAAAAANGYKPLDATWTRFNPMATVGYQAGDDLYVYAKYATGYRAGGASSRTSNYQSVDPEDVKSYEVGLKSEFFDRHARFNLAGYVMDRKNSQLDISTVQFTATGNFNNLVTINAPGITKIRGIEADLTVNPIENLTLNASYAYTFTEVPPVLITARAVSGTPPVTNTTQVLQNFFIVFTPRNAFSVASDYAIPLSGDMAVRLHLDAAYSQAVQTIDQFDAKNDSTFLVNGRLSITEIKLRDSGQKLNISLWGRNLFDQQRVIRRDVSNSLPAPPTTNVFVGNVGNVLGDYGNFNSPRMFGVEGTVRF